MEHIIEQMQNRLVEMDQRVNRLELKLAASGDTASNGAGGGLYSSDRYGGASGRGFSSRVGGASLAAEIRDLKDTVDPDALGDATQRILAKFSDRGLDERCTQYWETHPEAHLDLVQDVEDENLPPGRDFKRDESPYWMTRLHSYLAAMRTGDMNQIQDAVSKGSTRTKPLLDHNGVCVGKCSVNGKGGIPPTGIRPGEGKGKGKGKKSGKARSKGPY